MHRFIYPFLKVIFAVMELPYLVREPEVITPETPLLLMLHGFGSNEEDLFSFRETLPSDWLIVSFRAPLQAPFGGYSWYDIDFNDADRFVDVPQAVEALKAVISSCQDIRIRYGLRGSHTHLCGFSQGGVLSYALALTYPEIFSKVACLSSYPEARLLSRISKDKKALHQLKFFVSHGTDDAVIPLEWGRKAADLLYDLGCYFTFREYMSGHGVNQKNYMDLMDFLQGQL